MPQESRNSPTPLAIDAVVVEEEKSRLLAVGHGFPQLLNHPTHGRVGCDRKVNDLPATVGQDQEHVQRGEPNRVDGEEVDGPGDVQVIPQERQPSGGLASRVLGLDHILADRVFAGRLVAQEQQRVANLPRAPERILAAELSDQVLHLLGDGRPSRLLPGLPPPVELERAGVPCLDSRRLHQLGGSLPGRPELGQDDPQEPKAGSEPGLGLRLLLDPPLAHAQLALCGQQPGGQGRAALEEHADETQEVTEQLADASKTVPKVPEEVEDGIHAALIAEEASDGNLA